MQNDTRKLQIIHTVNEWAVAHIPFFLMVDFEVTEFYLRKTEELDNLEIAIQFPNFHFSSLEKQTSLHPIPLKTDPIPRLTYYRSFEIIKKHLLDGDSYLVNLTGATPIELKHSLSNVFQQAEAKYKILFRNEWVCFSPETFIKIDTGKIYAYPMKGTIDADLPHAQQLLQDDLKEQAEHATIVDLIRNDLNLVAQDVQIDQYRFFQHLKTNNKDLIQASSQISGTLPIDYLQQLGTILFALLPAGSISGAPKNKTLDIIHEAEIYPRGFYTGVAFYFDGQTVDSCVLIRFIERVGSGYVYKSGGGITIHSDASKEYNELNDKIYVPIL